MSLLPSTPSLVCHYGAPASAMELREDGIELHLQVPQLGGTRREVLSAPNASSRRQHDFLLLESDDLLLGFSIIDASAGLGPASLDLYSRLLKVAHGRHLYRVWNYVPRINTHEHGIERYRQFNIGRWQAFEQAFGNHLRSHLPAASAVGLEGDHLVLAFTAGHQPARHLENPEQVPAYHYPDSYGPRSPGFARASVVDSERLDLVFVSGTASIRGHASMYPGDLKRQMEVTLDNLAIMGSQIQTDLFDPSAASQGWLFKCYLRHARQFEEVQDLLRQRVGALADEFCYLQADICRGELDIEIEASRFLMR